MYHAKSTVLGRVCERTTRAQRGPCGAFGFDETLGRVAETKTVNAFRSSGQCRNRLGRWQLHGTRQSNSKGTLSLGGPPGTWGWLAVGG